MSTNSAQILGERAIPNGFRFGFVAGLVVLGCWGSTISYWRSTGSNPATGELALWLLGLPLSLVLVSFAGYKLITRQKAAATPAAVSNPVQASTAATPAKAAALAILAASLRSPHGSSAEELATAIRENKARADLDKELSDDDGFPIMTARSSDAQDDMLRVEIAEWLAQNGMAELHFSDEQWRALTLASAVTGELAGRAASIFLSQSGTPPMLRFEPMLPLEWEDTHRRAVSGWLKYMVAQYGWPADRIILPEETHDSKAESASAVFKRLAQQAAKASPLHAIVVACASHIGDDTVSRWAENDLLFTSSRPQGQIPGEGAAGLLITDRRQTQSIDSAVSTLLDGVDEARLESSIDENPRKKSRLLGEMAERALKGADVMASSVQMVIADTDLRSNRMLELMEEVASAMPQLDTAEQVLRTGVANGSCGAVPFMTSLILARHYVLELNAPVLCISNQDPCRREVAVIRSADAFM